MTKRQGLSRTGFCEYPSTGDFDSEEYCETSGIAARYGCQCECHNRPTTE